MSNEAKKCETLAELLEVMSYCEAGTRELVTVIDGDNFFAYLRYPQGDDAVNDVARTEMIFDAHGTGRVLREALQLLGFPEVHPL